MNNLNRFIFSFLFITTVNALTKSAFVMDERYVCSVKRSCIECLKFQQCSWCGNENKCFSLSLNKDTCSNNTIVHEDFGLSLQENAECSCSSEIEQQCYPPGVTEGPPCSDRGTCVCGRCVCSVPDPEETSKMVLGQYCEYDNFSCDNPKCNEGPYLLNSVQESYSRMADVDDPPTQ